MMSERRALLDSEMYKISEEDSQDEEVLSSLRSLSLRPFQQPPPPQPPILQISKGQELTVKWPSETESDNDSSTWTSSSSSHDQDEYESEDESSSSNSVESYSSTTTTSCSSCESRNQNKISSISKTKRRQGSKTYNLSKTDIEFQRDGSLRLIEFFSSSSTEESDQEQEFSNPGITSAGPSRPYMPASSSTDHSKSKTKMLDVSTSNIQQQNKNEGGRFLAQFMNQNPKSGITSRKRKRKKEKPPKIFHTTLKLNENGDPDRKFGLLESLLGIIPMRNEGGDDETRDRILVGGFCGDDPGGNNRHLRFGDWIRTINGIVVNSTNVDFILSALEQRHPNAKREVKVSITRASKNITDELTVETKQEPCISKYVIPNDEDQNNTRSCNFYLLYVKSGHNGNKSSIIYIWPSPDTQNINRADINVIEKLETSICTFEGVFGILKDVGGETASNVHVKLGNDLIDIGYYASSDEGNKSIESESFLLVGTALGSSPAVQIIKQIVENIKFKYGSLNCGFLPSNFKSLGYFLQRFNNSFDKIENDWMTLPIIAQLNSEQHEVLESYIWNLEDSSYDLSNALPLVGILTFIFGKLVLPLKNGISKKIAIQFHAWIGSEFGHNFWPSFKKLLLYQKKNKESSSAVLAVGFGGVILAALFGPTPKNINEKRILESWIYKFGDTVSAMASDPLILSIQQKAPNFSSELTPAFLKNDEDTPLRKQGKIQTAFSGIKNKIFKKQISEGQLIQSEKDSSTATFGSQSSLSSSSSTKDQISFQSQNDQENTRVFPRSRHPRFLLHLSRVKEGTRKFFTSSSESWDSYPETWIKIKEGILAVSKELENPMLPMDEYGLLITISGHEETLRFWIIGRQDSEGKSFACILDKDISPQLIENIFALSKGSEY